MHSKVFSFAVLGCCHGLAAGAAFSISVSYGRSVPAVHLRENQRTALHMAVTPIGPFCPFRSEAALEMEPRMGRLNKGTPDFATDLARIQLDMETGQTPDPVKMLSVANSMEESVDEWENLIARLRLSNDFQTKEYAKLTDSHLEKYGQTSEGIGKMMRWQSSVMKALARNLPPPPPPLDLDLMKMVNEAQSQGQNGEAKPPPSMAAMANASYIQSTPFKGTESAFDSPTVREEYEKLCRDHSGLIEMGASYATFDPVGKLAYLDEIEKVEERWDIFFARFSLLGALDKDFVDQCNAFLQSMGLDEANFRDLLRRAHQLMREDAERERDMVYS